MQIRAQTKKRTLRVLQGPWERGGCADAAPAPEPSQLPQTRGECEGGPRPCPLVSCKHNLAVSVTEAGSLRIPYPGPDGGPDWNRYRRRYYWRRRLHSCALDAAADEPDGMTLDAIGQLENCTRERVRQLIEIAQRRMRKTKKKLRIESD